MKTNNSKSQIEQVELAEEINPEFLYSLVANRLLVQIVRGKIDPIELAKETLASRGVITEKSMDEWENWMPR